jgi:16S rRNA (adenine1518-N6/adenine1519-N6)-dimethyltransferase
VSPVAVRELLERHGLLARRDLGQNFLVDPALARKLVARAGVTGADWVLEIGAGLGLLTRALAERARRVVALEVDAGLVRALRAGEGLPANAELHHADALEVDLRTLLPPEGPARVVASLPYAIASPLLRRVLDLRDRLEGWSVLVQREVAERLGATVGSPGYGSLAVLHALTVRVESHLDLHPRCFYPVPRITSRFVTVRPLSRPLLSPGELPWVERVVRAAFRHRRKTLVNSLRAAAIGPEAPRSEVEHVLARMGLDPLARAEQLGPAALLELARRLADGKGNGGPAHG